MFSSEATQLRFHCTLISIIATDFRSKLSKWSVNKINRQSAWTLASAQKNKSVREIRKLCARPAGQCIMCKVLWNECLRSSPSLFCSIIFHLLSYFLPWKFSRYQFPTPPPRTFTISETPKLSFFPPFLSDWNIEMVGFLSSGNMHDIRSIELCVCQQKK